MCEYLYARAFEGRSAYEWEACDGEAFVELFLYVGSRDVELCEEPFKMECAFECG